MDTTIISYTDCKVVRLSQHELLQQAKELGAQVVYGIEDDTTHINLCDGNGSMSVVLDPFGDLVTWTIDGFNDLYFDFVELCIGEVV